MVAAAAGLAAFGLVGQLYGERDSLTWSALEKVADKVNQVTPPGAPLYVDEPTFYLSRRPLPDGMEFSHSHKLELSPRTRTSCTISFHRRQSTRWSPKRNSRP